MKQWTQRIAGVWHNQKLAGNYRLSALPRLNTQDGGEGESIG